MEKKNQNQNQKIFRHQPILCPWITSQPYHSSLMNKNRSPGQTDPSLANRFLNNPWAHKPMGLGVNRSQDKHLPSIQQSSSQFFYFLRLMQLFPDTHPATLHTVLTLCQNDFFCAVDKLLYAKRYKVLCYKKNLMQKLTTNRTNKVASSTATSTAINASVNVAADNLSRDKNNKIKCQATHSTDNCGEEAKKILLTGKDTVMTESLRSNSSIIDEEFMANVENLSATNLIVNESSVN